MRESKEKLFVWLWVTETVQQGTLNPKCLKFLVGAFIFRLIDLNLLPAKHLINLFIFLSFFLALTMAAPQADMHAESSIFDAKSHLQCAPKYHRKSPHFH